MSNYGLNLGSGKNKKKRKTRTLIILFLCFALVLGSFSFLLLWKSLNFDFNNIFGTNESSTKVNTADEVKKEYEGVYIFAAGVTDDDAKNLLFAQLVSVDLKEKTVRVVPVPTDTVAKNGSALSEIAIKDGAKSFVSALEEIYSEKISRYCIFTESDYKAVFRTLGDITVTISQDIEYDTDNMFLELFKGENTLTPEKTYKYMKYLCTELSPEKSSSGCAEITVAAFKAFYTRENLNYADSLFETLINYCKTDITIVDFIEASEALSHIAPTASKDTVKVFTSKSVRESIYDE